jgi:speckle-type POZ protein
MVQRMVAFFYTGDYTDDTEEGDAVEDAAIDLSLPNLSIHAAMFALADKYNIEELSVLSAEKYSKDLTKHPDVDNFLLSIPEVYGSTPTSSRGLRDRALAFAREKFPTFLASPGAKECFDEVAADTPDFIKELLYSLMHDPLQRYCETCGRGQPVPDISVPDEHYRWM